MILHGLQQLLEFFIIRRTYPIKEDQSQIKGIQFVNIVVLLDTQRWWSSCCVSPGPLRRKLNMTELDVQKIYWGKCIQMIKGYQAGVGKYREPSGMLQVWHLEKDKGKEGGLDRRNTVLRISASLTRSPRERIAIIAAPHCRNGLAPVLYQAHPLAGSIQADLKVWPLEDAYQLW